MRRTLRSQTLEVYADVIVMRSCALAAIVGVALGAAGLPWSPTLLLVAAGGARTAWLRGTYIRLDPQGLTHVVLWRPKAHLAWDQLAGFDAIEVQTPTLLRDVYDVEEESCWIAAAKTTTGDRVELLAIAHAGPANTTPRRWARGQAARLESARIAATEPSEPASGGVGAAQFAAAAWTWNR